MTDEQILEMLRILVNNGIEDAREYVERNGK